MSFIFKSSTISIISRITIEIITKTTKIVIESIEKEFVTKIATKSIAKEFVSNEKESNWRNIFNNVALSIETTDAINATKATMNESTTSSNWDWDSDWDSDSNTKSRNDRESRIDESRNAEILSLFIRHIEIQLSI